MREIDFRQYHERGQVFVHRPQAISGPRADGRVAAELIAGVQMIEGGGMIDALSLCPTVDAEVVNAIGQVNEILADVHSRLAGLAEEAVVVARELSEDLARERRLRTTLAHELGHVWFHAFLWSALQGSVRSGRPPAYRGCGQGTILHARPTESSASFLPL